ncbi:hypothetical protein LTR91_004924 [Friedmanniomyces endolithicus]|uniref:Calcineurin-like phosphoesterase domain-containing protein n=1 Tax=Friedmanniomyces endolithicus TaxID=329885 RepID=A0A4U0V403_9PEZI|nr:hypothetical protein LTS09_012420 [Friedmanniomyces endolithicus]KAK0273698.1 hypothetical protein LTR35_012135 [Friedmanniomyces endolithicus]KAK0284387.1 hypothetical protein LTS00_011344 [Friedmanniomyces endolithicus]KAK0307247.1 hypothetical protein LTR01_005893 [Friedmanniomyces endolithicus]KAK0825670.1 hypothetical protein LTR73_006824 [Friedmanniomyces endolithicus]
MTRRITRTLTQLAGLLTLIALLLFLADSRYRVLPTSIHDRLPSHHVGTVVTDITITYCSSANPFSACRLDNEKWQRVEKDLYLRSGWLQSAWLHVQRRKEEELTVGDKVVVGVRVGRLDPGVAEKGQHDEKWESRPGGIWVLRSSKRHDSDSERAVTAVDVLFGADAMDPRPGWKLAQTPLLLEGSKDLQVARLSTRHGRPNPKADEKSRDTQSRVRKDGTFKILQVGDAHLSTGTGVCRDAIGPNKNEPSEHCEADPRTLDFLDSVLDSEAPDLVILSGDQVEGPSAPDTQSALFKLAAPLIERRISYAAIFGNHDDEGALSLSRSAQMGLLQNLPYSLSRPGPENVEGVGNYYLEILAPSPSTHSALTIYMLDTHGLTPDEKKYEGYDWLKPSQISWFTSTAQGLRKQHSKYSHFHLDMAFIHIPLPEYAEKGLVVKGGEWREGVTAPKFNSGFYDALADEGVVAVGCGHDHVNDYCGLRPGIAPATASPNDHGEKKERLGPWMCYAGGSGFGGYAGYGGYHRRVRVWEVDVNAGRIVTWKRVECCGEDVHKRIGELVVVEGGRVVGA